MIHLVRQTQALIGDSRSFFSLAAEPQREPQTSEAKDCRVLPVNRSVTAMLCEILNLNRLF